MNALRIAAVLLVAALAPAVARAQTAEDLIRKSGGDVSLASLPQSLKAGLDALRAQGLPVDDNFASAWSDAADAIFKPEDIVAQVGRDLSGVFSGAEAREIAEFYDSELGRRVVAFESDGAKFEKQAEITAFAKELTRDAGKYAARLALYQQLDDAAGLTKISVAIAMNMGVAIQTGMIASGKLPMALTFEDIKREAEKQRFAISQQVANALYQSMAYIYRDVSEADMLTYINFTKSPAGQKFLGAYFAALDVALTDASRAFGKRLAENFGRNPI